ncbi:MAG: DUF2382 domain-containing protein [Rubrobacteraceae bacterium]|nr:DUF2382 domain-containing protein [Rubrobacteraceae bacterium]
MAQKTAVHIELRDGAWSVVREGNIRATSTHPTQSEAAESGRELARRDGTEFFLHGQDGQIREHRDYREGQEDSGDVLDTALGTVGTVTEAADGITGTAAQTLGGGDARRESRTEPTADPPASTVDTGSDRTTGAIGEGRGLADEVRGEPVVTPEERYADYGIFDRDGERIGPLHDLFVDEHDEPEYIGVGTGLPANRSVLIPAEVVVFDDELRRIVVSRPRSVVETGPSLGYDEEVTREFERRVRLHYALEITDHTEFEAGRGSHLASVPEPPEPGSVDPAPAVAGREEDEVRVRRSEEELRVETRQHEAGTMRVRKRVRTDRERIEVPKKRVEVTVERVPVEGTTPVEGEISATPEIGEEEIVVPIVEEEIVVEKRPVVKEEIRIRKHVVEDVEVVEEDVRREEVEIDDQTHRDPDV